MSESKIKNQHDDALQTFILTLSGYTGQSYFDQLVRMLAEWLGVAYAIIGEKTSDDTVTAIAMYDNGQVGNGFSCSWQDSPCSQTEQKGFCVYPTGVAERFPKTRYLAEMNADGYVGVALKGIDDRTVGVVCAVSTEPLRLPDRAEALLKIIAARTASEIVRLHTERELTETTHALGERIKELDCLYAVLRLTENPAHELEDVMQGILELVPRAWQHPETTVARIVLNGTDYCPPGFIETSCRQQATIRIHGRDAGKIEVFFLEEKGAERPSLIVKKWLIKALADNIGRYLDAWTGMRENAWELDVNRTLSNISRMLIGKQTGIEDIAAVILDKLQAVTGATQGYVAEIDMESSDLVSYAMTSAMHARSESAENMAIRIKRGEDGTYPGLVGYSINTAQTLLTNEVRQHPAFKGTMPQKHVAIESLLSVPAMIGDIPVGQISLGNRPGGFSDKHRVFVEHVAQLYALALQQKQAAAKLARQNESLEKMVEERTGQVIQRQKVMEAVYRVAMAAPSTFKEMCDLTAETIAGILDAACVQIRRKLKDEFVTIAVWHKDGLTVDTTDQPHMCGLCREALEQGGVQVTGHLPDIYRNSLCLKSAEFKSFLGIAIRDARERDIGLVVVTDVRERIFSDEERHLLEIFSQYLSYEIERERAETRLQKAREMEIFGQLASGVAHEVRNPLNAILVVSEALFMELGDNPDYQTYVDHIKNQVDRLAHLMDDLLNLGRPLQLNSMHVATVRDLTENAVRQWRQTTLNKEFGVETVFEETAAGENLKVDERKFQQIFINLLENACQHGKPDAVIVITVSAADDERIRWTFRDRGKGIPEGDLEKVFNPFFTSRKGGTGLGTSIVKHFVTLHDGSVRIYNNDDGPGCTVEMVLPVLTETGKPGAY